MFLRKGEPPLSTYPVHNGSVHRVVYCPHSDMGVGNGTGTVMGSQWDWEHQWFLFPGTVMMGSKL